MGTRRILRRVTLWRFRCKLPRVRSRATKILSTKAALFVLLAFQLIVGLPLQTVQAALDRPAHMPEAMQAANADCPMHDAAHGATPVKQAPAGNHDCCHVSACQCQCVYTPAAFDLPPLADVATSVAIPSLSSAQFVAPRIDEFLRPPIA
jgi:hypothetical protein